MTPSTNGRDTSGKFLPGNSGGPGNPFASRVGKLRAALISAVSEEDVQAVVKAIVTAAKSGDIPAAKLFFDRVIGKPAIEETIEGERQENTARILAMLSNKVSTDGQN